MIRSKLSFALVSSGYAILLVAAYLDNLRGPLLPVLGRDLKLSFEQSGWFLTVGQVAGIIENIALIAISSKVSERHLATGASLLGLVAALLSPMITGFPRLIFFATILGCSLAAMSTVCNLLVVQGATPLLRSRLLAGLHTMYGIGSFAAGLIVSRTLSAGISWHWLLLALAPLHLLMSGFFAWRLPQTPNSPDSLEAQQNQKKALDYSQILVIAIFIFCVSGETTTSMWLSQFLVSARQLNPVDAAQRVSGFFAVMTVSRTLCWMFIKPEHESRVLILALIGSIISFLYGFFINNWAFALVGLIGPFFPIFLARVSREFNATWKTLTIAIFLGNQTALSLMNLGIGWVADRAGIESAFAIAPLLLVISLALLLFFFSSRKPPTPIV